MLKRQKVIVSLSALLTVVVLVTIWQFSAQSATESSSLSGGLAQMIAGWFGWESPNELVHFLRKMAHFTIYFALGCGLTGTLLYQRLIPLPLAVFLLGATFAALDEIHQIFVPGRGPGVLDVVLDTLGVMAGMVLVLSIRLIWHTIREDKAKISKSGS